MLTCLFAEESQTMTARDGGMVSNTIIELQTSYIKASYMNWPRSLSSRSEPQLNRRASTGLESRRGSSQQVSSSAIELVLLAFPPLAGSVWSRLILFSSLLFGSKLGS